METYHDQRPMTTVENGTAWERAGNGLPAAEWLVLAHWTRFDVPPRWPREGTKERTAVAFLEQGRWIVKCPFCPNGAQLAAKTDHRWFCTECLNLAVGQRWVPVAWPKRVTEIEVVLMRRPNRENRNCLPGETVEQLLGENILFGEILPGTPVMQRDGSVVGVEGAG